MSEKEDFELLKITAEELYKNINEVHCPYFKEKIIFNSLGMDHLKFKQSRKVRTREDQYMRFKLLHLAPIVISLSNTVQGIRITKNFEEIKINNRREFILKEIMYYEFIAVVGHDRVRIVLKQIEDGNKFFWSIIPVWKVDKKNMRRILYSNEKEN